MSAGKYTSLTIKQKLQVIEQYEKKNKNKDELAKNFKCSRSTINRILRQKNIIQEKGKTRKLTSKRDRHGACARVENALLKWFNQARSSGALISRNIIMEKASQFALQLGEDFTPTSGWLHRWQKRESISLQTIHGEAASADCESAAVFMEKIYPNLVSNYTPSQIFNADETALFYKAMPKKTLNKKGFEITGSKTSKERLTLLLICNATGDYKKAIVIGKTSNPRCFKNKNVPLKYYSQKKAWMTQGIWENVVMSLDKEMEKEKKKIVLFVDNAASHKITASLNNINLQFLPANTTAICQPIDQGIIHCFKSYYRQNIIRKQITAAENGVSLADFAKSIDILQAIHMIKHSWLLVKPISISNCFKKAKFISSIETYALDESVMEENSIIEQNIGNLNLTEDFQNYVQCDKDLPCHGVQTDEDIIQEILGDASSNDDEEEISQEHSPIKVKDALSALSTLQDFFLPEEKFSSELNLMEQYILAKKPNNEIQTKIRDFFS